MFDSCAGNTGECQKFTRFISSAKFGAKLRLWVNVRDHTRIVSVRAPEPPHPFPLNTLFACSAFAHQKPDYQIEEICSISRMYVMLSVSWSISNSVMAQTRASIRSGDSCFIPGTKLQS